MEGAQGTPPLLLDIQHSGTIAARLSRLHVRDVPEGAGHRPRRGTVCYLVDLLVAFSAPDVAKQIHASVVVVPATERGRIRQPRRRGPDSGLIGQTVRHRLNRAGDRQLNRALHTIVPSRLQHDEETRAYAARRLAEGKTPREVKRCLKRFAARRLFKLLEHSAEAA